MKTQTVTISNFVFINTSGSTSHSNSAWNEIFNGTCEVEITSNWNDYEIGNRFIGISADKKLTEYLNKNADQDDRRVFFCDFDIIN